MGFRNDFRIKRENCANIDEFRRFHLFLVKPFFFTVEGFFSIIYTKDIIYIEKKKKREAVSDGFFKDN